MIGNLFHLVKSGIPVKNARIFKFLVFFTNRAVPVNKTNNKHAHGFQRTKNNSGVRKLKYMVTDGLYAYKRAVNKEFSTNNYETKHLWNVGLQHHPNNNHVERLHGTIRNREKTMRGLKIEDTPIVDGNRIYYNFIKPHEALDGKTPSEEAGITIDGDNKWLTLMKTALWYKKAHSEVV